MFDHVYNSTLRIHRSVLQGLDPWIQGLMDHGVNKRNATKVIAFITNAISRNHFQPTRLNSSIIWRHFRVRTKWLVDLKILDIEGHYIKGKHCRSYLMNQTFQKAWVKPWIQALSQAQPPPYVEEILHEQDDPPQDDDWIDTVLNLDVDPQEVPLVQAFQFLKREDVKRHIRSYIQKLKNIEHPVDVEAIRENIRHGTQLVEEHEVGSPEWHQGMSYILPAMDMLENTRDGVFRPKYHRAESRFFERGLQQLPSGLNRQDVLLEGQVNYDQVSSHAIITQHLFRVIGIKESPLDHYIKDRKGLAKRLGIKEEALKTATMAVLNGASLSPFKNGKTLSAYTPFLEEYQDPREAMERYEDFVRWIAPMERMVAILSYQAKDLGAPRRDLANIGYVAQIIEFAHKAITVETSGRTLLGDQHDGFILDGPLGKKRDAALLTGVDLKYRPKPLGKTRKVEEGQEEKSRIGTIMKNGLSGLLSLGGSLFGAAKANIREFYRDFAFSFVSEACFLGRNAMFNKQIAVMTDRAVVTAPDLPSHFFPGDLPEQVEDYRDVLEASDPIFRPIVVDAISILRQHPDVDRVHVYQRANFPDGVSSVWPLDLLFVEARSGVGRMVEHGRGDHDWASRVDDADLVVLGHICEAIHQSLPVVSWENFLERASRGNGGMVVDWLAESRGKLWLRFSHEGDEGLFWGLVCTTSYQVESVGFMPIQVIDVRKDGQERLQVLGMMDDLLLRPRLAK